MSRIVSFHWKQYPSLTGGSLIAFLTLLHLISDAIASMFSALLPSIQARFQLNEAMLALLVALMLFSSAFTQPIFGALSDRWGRRRVGALGVILNSALLSLVGVAPTLPLLIVLIIVGGLGAAALHPAGSSLARSATSERRTLAVSLFSAGGTLGVALGPVLVLALISTFGLQASPWLMAPGIMVGVLMWVVVPSPSEFEQADDHARLFDLRLLAGPIGILGGVAILINLASLTFISAAPLWLVSEHNIPRDAALLGWTLTAFSLSAAAGGVIAGFLNNYIPPRGLIAGALLLALFPFFAVLTVQPGTALYFLFVGLAGALAHAALPLLVVKAQDRAPQATAMASGILMGFAAGVAGITYIGIGWLQQTIGLTAAMQIGFMALVPGALLAWYALRPSPAQTSEDTPQTAAASCGCPVPVTSVAKRIFSLNALYNFGQIQRGCHCELSNKVVHNMCV
jgi:MFS transporter, FSR family, fosmidomycin resistance protein